MTAPPRIRSRSQITRTRTRTHAPAPAPPHPRHGHQHGLQHGHQHGHQHEHQHGLQHALRRDSQHGLRHAPLPPTPRPRYGPGSCSRSGPALRALRLALALLLCRPALAAAQYVLIVSGLGGEPAYRDAFYEWGAAMADAARTRYGLPDSSVIFLAERPARDPARIRARSTKAEIARAISELAARSEPGDRVLILLIGHGSAAGGEARLNLPGPDLTASELATMLDHLAGREVAVVNAASASGAFLEPLAAKGRLVVTATRNAAENNETLFARHFVHAYAGDGADADRDGRVTLFEAFDYARREVARAYARENRLLTEHALLDGDGDGAGSREPTPSDPDGRAAHAFVLEPAPADAARGDPALQRLLERQRALERRVAELRAARDTLDPAAYERELERVLLELAETGRAIREKRGGGA
ncbi:MAG TPA: C13 family peptidase [Longimicrobiales bacterium]